MTRTTPSTSAQGPVAGWRYSINYGPDGEENYANVYAADGHLVGNLRTHHAIDICNAFAVCDKLASPSPASPASPSGVRVKPLEWHRVTYGWLAFEEWYRIEDNGPNWTDDRFWLYERGDRLGKFGTLEDAQAAMQVRHDQRISAALAKPASEPAGGDVREAAEQVRYHWEIIQGQCSEGDGFTERAATDLELSIVALEAALSSSAGPAVEEGFAYRDENGDIAYQAAHPAPAAVEMREILAKFLDYADADYVPNDLFDRARTALAPREEDGL